jgi:AcrR family transcriptional regulator
MEHKPGAVRKRLLEAALECFLADEYRRVTTRRIAARARANVSMIRYYFGSKEGLFEEMVRETLAPLLEVLDSNEFGTTEGFGALLALYYRTMIEYPAFPRLILKVLALNEGPGRPFIRQLLERGRAKGARRIAALKDDGQIGGTVDPEMLRLSFVSLAMMPMLLKELFEEQTGRDLDEEFLEGLARFNGHLITEGLRNL